MKKIILSILTLIFASSMTAFAAFSDGSSFINVSMTKQAQAVPDIATITFAVETRDSNSKIASDKNKMIATKVIEDIKSNLEAGETVETKGFALRSEYEYINKVRTLTNYQVTNTIEVKIKDIGKLGKIINTAIQAGANRVNNLSYDVENKDILCDKLISQVGKSAYNRAQSISHSLNLKVRKVKSAEVSCSFESNNYPRMFMAKGYDAMNSAETGSVPTEMGSVMYSATFDGQFWVK